MNGSVVKNWFLSNIGGNCPVILGIGKAGKKTIYNQVMQMNETPAVPTQKVRNKILLMSDFCEATWQNFSNK